MAELAQAQSILKETLAKVAALEAQFDEANTKKVRVVQNWYLLVRWRYPSAMSTYSSKLVHTLLTFQPLSTTKQTCEGSAKRR